MPLPFGRPDTVLKAIQAGFEGRSLWPRATTNPDAHYQNMGRLRCYLAETPEGFVLTELGRREIQS